MEKLKQALTELTKLTIQWKIFNCELRHLIGREKAETQLKLIRDVFTPDKSQITDSGELVEGDNRHYGNTFPPGSF